VDRGKNMVGAFYQPAFVYFNLHTLHTLPEREWDCGLAEMCKHALLESTGSIYKFMRMHVSDLRNAGAPALRQAVLDSAAFKASVVARDERESGLRAILNLGHTTAHAIESITGYRRFSHGEAVARGLVTALILSRDILDYSRTDEMLAFMRELRLPMDTAELSGESLWDHMQYDKKAVQGVPEFVLLDQSATAVYGRKVTREQFLNAWQEQRDRCG
ncbi:MAG: 3-dehydroquinate synthase, partial [Leptospiraceae bacterium]|nr:3-dehydroquinate synthase [Leptospiraceae bacterium]